MNILRSLKLGQSFSMALKSIKNNKGRSFLTMLGIIIGLAAVITLVTLISGVQKQFMMSFEQMGTNVVQVEYYMDQNRDISREIYDKTLELSELVEAYTPNISTHNQVQHKDKSVQCRIMLGSESYDKCSNYTIERGTMFTYPNIQTSAFRFLFVRILILCLQIFRYPIRLNKISNIMNIIRSSGNGWTQVLFRYIPITNAIITD